MEKKLLKTGLIIKMKEILTRLINHENLDEKESKEILIDISMGKYNREQVASFLTVFMFRGTSTNELIGFRDALLELCVKLDFSDFETIDLCGTGVIIKIHLISLPYHLLLQLVQEFMLQNMVIILFLQLVVHPMC